MNVKNIAACLLISILASCSSGGGVSALPESISSSSEHAYSTIEAIRWKHGSQLLEARFEELVDPSVKSGPNPFLTVLIVEDLTKGKVLFQKQGDDHGSLLQRANFFVEGEPTFIAVWTAGSRDSLEVYTISGDNVRERLREPFQDTFIPITSPVSGETDLYLADRSSVNNEPVMKRFVLSKGVFVPAGQTSPREFQRRIQD